MIRGRENEEMKEFDRMRKSGGVRKERGERGFGREKIKRSYEKCEGVRKTKRMKKKKEEKWLVTVEEMKRQERI